MDFVDLDKVLDEFEEEEKQALSIVPGQELKPSGYLEFLNKHQEQEWASFNSSKFSSSSGYTLERRSVRDPASVSYDDPYDSFSTSKLDFITDSQIETVAHNGYDQLASDKNEAVTSVRKFSGNIEDQRSSEPCGTIAYQPIEVHTGALSSSYEHELMSSPFSKSDTNGQGNSDISVEQACIDEVDQNHSPIYASMNTHDIADSATIEEQSSASFTKLMNENQMQNSGFNNSVDEISALNSAKQLNVNSAAVNSGDIGTEFAFSAQAVGFHDPTDEDLDDSDINMYLSELDEGKVGDFSSESKITINVPIEITAIHPSNNQSEFSHVKDSRTRSLADELTEAEPEIDHFSESLPKRFCSDEAFVSSGGISNYLHQNVEDKTVLSHNRPQNMDTFQYENTTFTESNGKISSLASVNDKNFSVFENKNVQNAYSTLMSEKLEIEHVLDDRCKRVAGEPQLPGKMEIESILDEVILNQQNEVQQDVRHEHILEKPGSQHSVTSQSAHDHSSNSNIITPAHSIGVGARPKDPSAIKKNRPNSLLGLSKVTLEVPVKPDIVSDMEETSPDDQTVNTGAYFPDVAVQSQQFSIHRHQDDCDSPSLSDARQKNGLPEGLDIKPVIHDFSESYNQTEHDHSPIQMEGNVQDACQVSGNHKMKRPTSLNLPARPEFSVGQAFDEDMEQEVSPGTANHPDNSELLHDGAMGMQLSGIEEATIPVASPASVIQTSIGHVAPFWTPDADASDCMMCHTKFTIWKRRHHCRACGKVFCSVCCSQKAYLPYMENKEARVCVDCHTQLNFAPGAGTNPRCPNPNNPNEYCSKVPPNQQASNHVNPPVVMVPTGVLRTSGSQRRSGEPKQVMFSDGIRPGGDLTELDGPDQVRPTRRSARTGKRAAQQHMSPQMRKLKENSLIRSPSLIPDEGLPPLFVLQGDTGYVETDETFNKIDYTADYRSEEGPLIMFAINKNLAVGVKIITLDCCVNRVCWCFVTRGMNTAGQSELLVLLELTEDEIISPSLSPPRDIFVHFQMMYEDALKGSTIQDLGHSICHQNFLGNRDHGGFLFLRPTFQCLNKLPLPEPPYLIGILLQKWEVPWAKVFPIRLMLRLGAEYRYYPCSLVSVRNRKPVFFEIGHTIINLLADFRNYQYMLSQIRGVTIHMENKKTVINFPRNKYNDVMKVLRNSNEHVMALGSSFSLQADSHLVCIQNEDGNYQTQAINIQNKPRLVTGASFVVFNGALKASSGLKAKSSIVEDGLMVQILPEEMASVKEAMKNMADYVIQCGPVDASEPEESVELRWVDNDRNVNIGVKSYIDGTSLEGVESVSVKAPTDFLGDNLALRWTRVYFLHHEDSTSSHFDPLDLSRLTEDIAQACCTALVKHLDELKNEGQVKIGLRVNLTADSVGFEIGSKERPLPPAMMNSLDTYLIPIVHQASEEGFIMELVFNIVE